MPAGYRDDVVRLKDIVPLLLTAAPSFLPTHRSRSRATVWIATSRAGGFTTSTRELSPVTSSTCTDPTTSPGSRPRSR